MPHKTSDNLESVFLNDMQKIIDINISSEFISCWDRIQKIRDGIKKVLEIQRKNKVIGSSLEADITIFCKGEMYEFIKENEKELQDVLIVSNMKVCSDGAGEYLIEDVEGLSINIDHSSYGKCERCWTYHESVGKNEKHPTICSRCAEILG